MSTHIQCSRAMLAVEISELECLIVSERIRGAALAMLWGERFNEHRALLALVAEAQSGGAPDWYERARKIVEGGE